MAIRKREGKARPWQVYWRNPFSGRQESACYETLKEAEKADDMIKFRLKHERDSFRKAAPAHKEEDEPDNSFEAIFYSYLKEKQFNKETLHMMLTSLRQALLMIGRKRIDCISRQDLAAILMALSNQRVKDSTRRSYMRRLYTIIRWAQKHGFLETLPQFPDLPHAQYEHFVPPTPEECSAIMRCAPPHVQRIILFGSKFGIRVGPSEMFKLRWQDIDFSRSVVRVQAAAKNKAEPWREVPIKSSLLPLLRIWHDEDAKLGVEYVIHFAGAPIKSIQTAWNASLRRAGIKRHIRPYDLRHAFATDAIAAGADVGTVAKLMGHVNAEMVLTHYQHVLTKQKKAAVEALPDVPLETSPNGGLYALGLYAQTQEAVMQ